MAYFSRLLPICLLFLLACGPFEENSNAPYLYVADDFSVIAVESAPDLDSLEATRRFKVFLLSDDKGIDPDQSSIAGKYIIEDGRISFAPNSTFKSGSTYRARFYTGKKWLERDFYVVSADRIPSTSIEEVYPTIPYIPQNIRKFHIHFSDSMSPKNVIRNIQIVNEYGETIKGLFTDENQATWSTDLRKLTIELPPIYLTAPSQWRADLDARFTLFQTYKLVIEKNIRDSKNRPLTKRYYREFKVSMPNRNKVNISVITGIPPAGTLYPVILNTRKPLNVESMSSHISVTDKEGKPISGTYKVGKHEQQWTFTPDKPWEAKQYQVRMKNKIEDLAGNTRLTTFDEREKVASFPGVIDYYPLNFWPK